MDDDGEDSVLDFLVNLLDEEEVQSSKEEAEETSNLVKKNIKQSSLLGWKVDGEN